MTDIVNVEVRLTVAAELDPGDELDLGELEANIRATASAYGDVIAFDVFTDGEEDEEDDDESI